MQTIKNMLFAKLAPRLINHIGPLDYKNVDPLAKAVIKQLTNDFELTTVITMHLPNPRLMAGVWSALRESLIVGTREERILRESVATVVSQLNQCPFCVDAHTSMLHALGSNAVANNLLQENIAESDNQDIDQIMLWARASLTPGADILKNPPFTQGDAPQLIGTAVFFNYINRMVSLFLHSSPFPLVGSSLLLRKGASKLFARMLSVQLNKKVVGGKFLLDVSNVKLPEEFSWAATNADVSGGFIRFATMAEEAGQESVPEPVRELVNQYISGWAGEAPGLSRVWVEDGLVSLQEKHKPSARLALLTAVAAYQVDKEAIDTFRAIQPSERDLINTACWASYSAARRIGSWLHAPH